MHIIHVIYIFVFADFLNLNCIESQILLCPIYPKVSFSAFLTYIYQKVEQGRSCVGVLSFSLPLTSWPQHSKNSVQNLAHCCFSHLQSGNT